MTMAVPVAVPVDATGPLPEGLVLITGWSYNDYGVSFRLVVAGKYPGVFTNYLRRSGEVFSAASRVAMQDHLLSEPLLPIFELHELAGGYLISVRHEIGNRPHRCRRWHRCESVAAMDAWVGLFNLITAPTIPAVSA